MAPPGHENAVHGVEADQPEALRVEVEIVMEIAQHPDDAILEAVQADAAIGPEQEGRSPLWQEARFGDPFPGPDIHQIEMEPDQLAVGGLRQAEHLRPA